jgi:Arc/MetJ-type ribon-helix-helix transcriptional regulator
MTTNVSPENERFIRNAIAEGRFTSWDDAIDKAVHLLREGAGAAEADNNRAGNVQEWISELRAWAASHRGVETPVNYDRDSIYAGRGE